MASIPVTKITVDGFNEIASRSMDEELNGLTFASSGSFAAELEGRRDVSDIFSQDEVRDGYLVGFRCGGIWVHVLLDSCGTPLYPCILG